MTEATTTTATTSTVRVPGATVTYDVRPGDGTTGQPPLMLIGSPMGAGGFATLAGHFADRTVLTYDPRGVERSTKDDPSTESTPEQHADDIHAVIAAAGGGPVDLFASSGGAVNALALVARHPDDVRILVAHEPPLAALTSDRAAAFAATEDIRDTYQRDGMGPAMAKFIILVSNKGDVPADFASMPVDPAMFGLPTQDDGSRNDALLQQNIITCTHFEPDFDALRAAPTDDRDRGRRGVSGPAGPSRRRGRGSAPRPVAGHLPGWPRRIPRRRVRPDRQARRVRREAPRGPRRQRLTTGRRGRSAGDEPDRRPLGLRRRHRVDGLVPVVVVLVRGTRRSRPRPRPGPPPRTRRRARRRRPRSGRSRWRAPGGTTGCRGRGPTGRRGRRRRGRPR